jgi:hypothetical protein
MALTRTTLAAACAAGDNTITLTAAGTMAARLIILIDGELMSSTPAYVNASTTVPVLRGQGGTSAYAHPITAGVVYGTLSDFTGQAAQSSAQFLYAGRPVIKKSYSASGAIDLPAPGSDLIADLNAVSTTVLTMTIPAPTKEMDGCSLTLVSHTGTGAHVIYIGAAAGATTGDGLNGAGTSYDQFTFPANPVMLTLRAFNSFWFIPACPAITGTVTLLTGGIA